MDATLCKLNFLCIPSKQVMRVALVLCFCACVGAMQFEELLSSALPASSALKLQRREATAVQFDYNNKKTPAVDGTAVAHAAVNATDSKVNATAVEAPVKKLDLSRPGVLKRAVLVFGGFGLLALAYFIFYRRRNKKNESDNMNHASDGPQFRYGVLQTDEGSDRMELSHMPLTMDSDEDEDDDLEIFDLGQKKKSLSYVNLHTDDRQSVVDDILASKPTSQVKDQLLLDIEYQSSPAVLPLTVTKTTEII